MERKKRDIEREFNLRKVKEVEKMTREYEAKIEAMNEKMIRDLDSLRRDSNFNKMRQQHDRQTPMKSGDQEETKSKNYEDFVPAARHSDELLRTTQNLSETISNVEERNKRLTQKVNSNKIYQKVFK